MTQLTISDSLLLRSEQLKDLIAQEVRAAIEVHASLSEEVVRTALTKLLPTTTKQRKTIEKIVISTLRTPKAGLVIREQVADSSVSDNKTVDTTPIKKRDFHTRSQIRRIIVDNIEAISTYFDNRVFSLMTFRDHIQTYIEFLPGDLEPYPNFPTRLDSQITSAIHGAYSPLEKAETRGRFRINYEPEQLIKFLNPRRYPE